MKAIALSSLIVALVTGCANAPTLVRHPLPNSNFPIAQAVEVRGDLGTVYLSGQVPPNLDPTPASDRPAVYGVDTKSQTIGTLQSIERTLKGLGLTMGDVIKMQVFLVGDPAKGGRMDFAGFMEGYTQFFGTAAQPNLPSRSVFQVVSLANAAWFVEIEVVAIRK
jgi:enamine deaminase RidA (YjgF/YER057c/UK114 family)